MADKKKPSTHQEKVRSTPIRLLEEIAKSEVILEAIGDAISVQDRTFKIIYENKVHRKIFGDHVGGYCYKAYKKREDVCDGCNLALTFKDGAVHKVLRELQTDKETRYFEITSSPLKDTKGKIIAGIEVVRDVTEHKRVDESLKKTENLLTSIFAALDGLLIVIDKDLRVVYSNWKEHEFIPKEKRLGHPYCYEVFKYLKAPCEYCPPKETFIDGKFRIYEDQNPVDGSYKEISASPVFDSTGKVVWVVQHVRDITERKKAERLITDALTFNKTILRTSPIGIVTFKASGQCVSANDAIAKMVGGTVEKLLKQDFRRLESWKRSGMLEAAEDVLATGTVKTMDINVVSTFGKEVWFACRFVPFQFEDQPHLLALFTDISKRKRVEEELRKSEQQLRNLTAYAQKVAEIERTNIAREIHDELAQTLTVLKMDLTWLKKKLPVGQNPMTEKINTMLKAIDRTIETMKRIATDLRPGILDDLGLAAAIEWQADEFQKQTGIKCKVALDSEDIILDRDRNTAIFRIFQETLTNVARHAKATQVTVSLKEKEGKIKLTVKDNGKGITKEEIAHPKSYGLMGIGERAKILNGNSIIKGVHGKGTSVTVEIPVHEKKKKESYLLNNTPSTTGVTE